MDQPATPDPFDYSPERLLRETASECAELRGLLAAVAGDLERLAAEYPDLASRFWARAKTKAQAVIYWGVPQQATAAGSLHRWLMAARIVHTARLIKPALFRPFLNWTT